MAQASKFVSFGVVQWLSSIVLSLLVVVALVALTLSIADWAYVLRHPIAAYEEDLGYGLVMMAVLVVCAVIAVPATGLLAWRLKKFIAHRVYENTHP